MVDEYPSTPADAGAVPGTSAGAGIGPGPRAGSLEAAREEYLRLLLQRLEDGRLEAYEYTRRVRSIELATSVSAMADIVDAAVAATPSLDAVDMLRMAQVSPMVSAAGHPRRVALFVMIFFFAVLLAFGIWLAAHARALHSSGTGGPAVVQWTAQAPPSSLGSWRR